ncbi:tRNA (guanine-N(1)-)-methyltransferase [Saezia sanguinis]|uniref:tRNA (guanine-N(1)-)-methyltransferase n=1 Tax=Saezia sanguinis TaxID=1965230 RepID=A0A433SI63_9BURK|nr:tRNA (guanosine(37)-N1)-methyltransferase TrmD [Saezia sanguinis]RUS68304.1 tRNA (guanine-N(1)-)-methyltransferase [Saezia sanguinis]
MRFDVVTLFPELFAPFLTQGITRRAFSSGMVDVHMHQLRDFTEDNYHRVDDRPYGGGPGMVMLAQPLERCIQHVYAQCAAQGGNLPPVLLFSPAGRPMTHQIVSELAQGAGAILLCGRYEGIDQRFIDHYVQMELSLGDFVLSGGEIPAMALLDAVARLQPGVLGDDLSSIQDSFHPVHDGLLDYPHYTRPERLLFQEEGDAQAVPSVLLSGDHAKIARWRREQQLQLTWQRRPELIEKALSQGLLDRNDRDFLEKIGYNKRL